LIVALVTPRQALFIVMTVRPKRLRSSSTF
jgi:hypothetical protein